MEKSAVEWTATIEREELINDLRGFINLVVKLTLSGYRRLLGKTATSPRTDALNTVLDSFKSKNDKAHAVNPKRKSQR